MKHRSPLIGFNHNVRHLGRVFHVQTEDSGVGNPHLFTHLFFGGTILATKRVDYDPSANETLVRSLMQSQHKALLRDLKNGIIDEKIRSFFERRGEPVQLADAGPLESEPVEAPPPPEVLAAAESAEAPPLGEDQLDLPIPPGLSDVSPFDEEGPVVMLAPPPRPMAAPDPGPMASPDPPPAAAFSSQPPPGAPDAFASPPPPLHMEAGPPHEDEGPVITLSPPPPREPTPPRSVPAAPPIPGPPLASPPREPVPRPQAQALPNRPLPGGQPSGRRIWAKKGGGAERPFDDSGSYRTAGELARSQPGLPADEFTPSASMPAEITDVPPGMTASTGRSSSNVQAELRLTPPPAAVAGADAEPLTIPSPPPAAPPPAPEPAEPMADAADDGPVVVLAAPPSTAAPRRPADPAPRTPHARTAIAGSRPATDRTPMSVTTSSPSADGMVAKRPPPTPAAKSSARAGVIQGAPQRPPPAPPRPSPGPPPVVVGSPQPPRPRAPMGAAPGIPMQKPPTVPPREASVDSIFGEDLISEKSLDEVILAYLAEDAKHPK